MFYFRNIETKDERELLWIDVIERNIKPEMVGLAVLTGIDIFLNLFKLDYARLMMCFHRLVAGALDFIAFIESLQYYINIQ